MPRAARHPALASGRALDTLKTLASAPPAIREQILALASITPRKLAKLVRKSFREMNRALAAERVQRLVVPGGKGEAASVEQFTDIDFSTRLQAADMLLKVAAIYPSRAAVTGDPSAPQGIVNVNVTFADVREPAKTVPAELGTIIDVPALDSKRDAIADGTQVAQPAAREQ